MKPFRSIAQQTLDRTFIKFCITGVANTLTDFIVFTALYKAGFAIVAANFCAFTIAACLSYLLNKRWVFSHPHPASVREFAKFYCIVMITMACNTGLIYGIGIVASSVIAAKILATAVTLLLNYTLLKRYFKT